MIGRHMVLYGGVGVALVLLFIGVLVLSHDVRDGYRPHVDTVHKMKYDNTHHARATKFGHELGGSVATTSTTTPRLHLSLKTDPYRCTDARVVDLFVAAPYTAVGYDSLGKKRLPDTAGVQYDASGTPPRIEVRESEDQYNSSIVVTVVGRAGGTYCAEGALTVAGARLVPLSFEVPIEEGESHQYTFNSVTGEVKVVHLPAASHVLGSESVSVSDCDATALHGRLIVLLTSTGFDVSRYSAVSTSTKLIRGINNEFSVVLPENFSRACAISMTVAHDSASWDKLPPPQSTAIISAELQRQVSYDETFVLRSAAGGPGEQTFIEGIEDELGRVELLHVAEYGPAGISIGGPGQVVCPCWQGTTFTLTEPLIYPSKETRWNE